MRQQALFEVPETPKQLEIEGRKCRTCQHAQRWQCNSKFFFYCGVRKSNRTQNGLLKIKLKNNACLSYKEEI